MSRSARRVAGDSAFARADKVNSELMALTYGAFVVQMVRDLEDPDEVSTKLESIGASIGIRIVDEFLAKNPDVRCRSFQDSMATLGEQALRMFLGVSGDVGAWSEDKSACTLTLPSNPLALFVELPPGLERLQYSALLCGAVRGALEGVGYKVHCSLSSDAARGDTSTELRVALLEVMEETAGDDYKEE